MKVTDRFRKMCVSNPWLQKMWKKADGDWYYHPEQRILIQPDKGDPMRDYLEEIDEGVSLVHPGDGDCGYDSRRVDEIAKRMYWIPNLNQLMELAEAELGKDGYSLRRDINTMYWAEQMHYLNSPEPCDKEKYWLDLDDNEIVLAYLMWMKDRHIYDFKKEIWCEG